MHTAYGNKPEEKPPSDEPSEAPMLNLPPLKRQVYANGPVDVNANLYSVPGLFDMMGDLFGSKERSEPTVESLSVGSATQASATRVETKLHSTFTAADSLVPPEPTNSFTSNSILSTHLTTWAGEPPLVIRDQLAEVSNYVASTETTMVAASSTLRVSTIQFESVVHTTSHAPNPTALPLRGKKDKTSSSCTPSPTASMAPSASKCPLQPDSILFLIFRSAWTTCPYKARDGRVNPDVRQLKNAAELVDMSQASIWNAVAAVSSGSKSTTYSKNVVSFIDTFFLNDATKMKPNAEYGQVVRGPPGTQGGTYMGVLDFRGMVKVVNAILVLREMKSREWTADKDANMNAWADAYLKWVETDPMGKKAAKAAKWVYILYFL